MINDKHFEAILRLRSRGWGLTTYLLGNLFVHSLLAFSALVDPSSLEIEHGTVDSLIGICILVNAAILFIWKWKIAGVLLLYPLLIAEIMIFKNVGIESAEISHAINIIVFSILAVKKFPYFSGDPMKIKEFSDYEILQLKTAEEQQSNYTWL